MTSASFLYREEKAPTKPWANYFGLALIALQFFLVMRVLNRFQLESDAFRTCIQIAFYGFIVHHLLPMKARLPFFFFLSLGVTGYVLGLERGGFNLMTSLPRTGTLLVLGAILVGICHLPLHFYARVGILSVVGVVLWLMRAELIPVEGPMQAIWPVFGAMFMFRLIVYLYDLQHEKTRPPLARIGSYFLMLPNVALTLFPVVDYKTFSKNYYNEEVFTAYQRGVHWMARGVILLVLWRLIYYHIHIGPVAVKDGTDLIRFMLSNILLYLRVPGEFHLVIGLLTLFGFNLPETNKKFLFADSFLDYWRRVNIYWKDFMMKIVFYPTIFRMKTWNQTTAMIAATTLAFIFTWALHSYQWFWLRGTFPIISQDIIFWSILGVLVIVNSVVEQRSGRQRALGNRKPTPKEIAVSSLKTAGVFTTMTILWSFWNVESVPQWLGLMKLVDASWFGYFLIANVVIVVSKYVFEQILTPPPPPKKKLGAPVEVKIVPIFPFKQAALWVVLPLMAVFFVTSGRVVRRMGPEAEVVVMSLANTKPNAADQAQMERGYYDDLMDVSRFNSQLNESLTRAPADWKKLEDTDAVQLTNDHRINSLVPSKTTIVNGKTITTNQWGMRDKSYEMQKPEGTYRIAMLGSSHVLGWGVNDSELFEPQIEERLNTELKGKPWDKYEILNFSMNGYSPICQITTIDKDVARFKPNALWFVAHVVDPFWVMSRFAKAIRKDVPPPYPYLAQLQKEVELDKNTPDLWAQRKLTPRWKEMMKFAYEEIVKRAKAMGAEPVWIFMPGIVEHGESTEDGPIMLQLAKDAGFTTIVLPYSMYKAEPRDKLEIAPWDAHPNAYGHKLIADGLWKAITETKDLTIYTRTATTAP